MNSNRLRVLSSVAKPCTRIIATPSTTINLNVGLRYFSSKVDNIETKEFKAETKRLLEIVANSLYHDREVFVRELVSNASDACEKLRYHIATNQISLGDKHTELKINIFVDPSKNLLAIQDNGIGMSKEELIEHLGTIAKSGTRDFAKNTKDTNSTIGQFGVGFYSTFAVADKVSVLSRYAGSNETYLWESKGDSAYSIQPVTEETMKIFDSEILNSETLPESGTRIILHLKEDASIFSAADHIQSMVEKSSSFINLPVSIITKESDEVKTIDVPVKDAVWFKANSTKEDHTKFFRQLDNNSLGEPQYTITYKSEAPVSLKCVFYIPTNAPSRMFTRDPSVGISLYSRRVLLQKHADKIIPRWMFFVKGVVDCEDIPLNISREGAQDARLIRSIRKSVVSKVLRYLKDQSKKDPETYARFIRSYGYYMKAALLDDAHSDSGEYKQLLSELLRFTCLRGNKETLMSLSEYKKIASEEFPNQEDMFFYHLTSNVQSAPALESYRAAKVPVLILRDDIDEFVVALLEKWEDWQFKSADSQEGSQALTKLVPDLASTTVTPSFDLLKDGETSDIPRLNDGEAEELLTWAKNNIDSKFVESVVYTSKGTTSPAIVSSMLTPHMRRLMKQMATQDNAAVQSVPPTPMTLELNKEHPAIAALLHVSRKTPALAKQLLSSLFHSSALAGGFENETRDFVEPLSLTFEAATYTAAGFEIVEKDQDISNSQNIESQTSKVEETSN